MKFIKANWQWLAVVALLFTAFILILKAFDA